MSEATRSRILDAAKAVDYRPNVVARALRTARTNTIGIVVPQLDNPVFSSSIRGAEQAAAARGYSLLIAHRDPGRPATGEYERLAAAHRVDGLLVAGLDDGSPATRSCPAMSRPI